jgi:hypothetical protein
MTAARLVAPAVLLAGAAALGGCGKTVDHKSVERQLTEYYGRQLGAGLQPKVSCPSGQSASKGTRFTCSIRVGGGKGKVEVTMTANDKFTFRTL